MCASKLSEVFSFEFGTGNIKYAGLLLNTGEVLISLFYAIEPAGGYRTICEIVEPHVHPLVLPPSLP